MPGGLAELLVGDDSQLHSPAAIFEQLRWGGVFLYTCSHALQAQEMARRFAAHGFAIERGPGALREDGWLGLRWPLLSRKVHYVAARKMLLIPPGQTTDRFTYDVQLVRGPGRSHPLVVSKQVPTLDGLIGRLRAKFPDTSPQVIEKRARKFVDRIFPTFLTREVGILRELEKHLPPAYASRVPRVIDLERDERGFVQRLRMNWLRNGGEPRSHLDFAWQSADLLRVIHDTARVIHLDLRMDNFVVTPQGVGFVDFGSSVRQDEDVERSPLLSSLYSELMRTSQIQRMLEQMTLTGAVTSHAIRAGYRKIDKAVDLFYLAVQFNSPLGNPDLAGLIVHEPDSLDALALAQLTRQVLRPAEPARPLYRSAADILRGVERIRDAIRRG